MLKVLSLEHRIHRNRTEDTEEQPLNQRLFFVPSVQFPCFPCSCLHDRTVRRQAKF
jgi:hypothetical protein